MMHLDEHPDVIEWSSEEIKIPYIDPTTGKRRTYFPDFFVRQKNKDGIVENMLIEVKPLVQTVAPEVKISKGQKPTRRYLNEVMTWGVNSAKWKCAEEYCKDRGWRFVILTEKELGIKF